MISTRKSTNQKQDVSFWQHSDTASAPLHETARSASRNIVPSMTQPKILSSAILQMVGLLSVVLWFRMSLAGRKVFATEPGLVDSPADSRVQALQK